MQSYIMCNKDGKLETKNISLTTATDICTVDFYVSASTKIKTQVFLVLKDPSSGLYDVVELAETENSYGRPVFRVPLISSLRLINSRVELQLCILDVDKSTFEMSDKISLVLSTKNYKLLAETAQASNLSREIKAYYEAIVKALKEIVEKGENVE